MKEYFGKRVKCSGYTKASNDSIRIQCYKDAKCTIEAAEPDKAMGFKAIGYDVNGNAINEVMDDDGCVEKTLRQIVKSDFTGIVVGHTDVALKMLLCIGHDDNPYHECNYIFTETKESCECYKVYYATNKSRYVPVELCEEIEQ